MPSRRGGLALCLICCAMAQTSCGDSTEPRVAASLTAATSTVIAGVAGEEVNPSPSVSVRDQNGAALAGVPVVFAVTGGGGTIVGASQISNANGIATLAGWTLGQVAGSNTLSATAEQTTPIVFTATGATGPPAAMTPHGDGQTAPSGTPVPIAPSVTVTDQYGNAVAGVGVTFAPGLGGGSVTGANATTDATGLASVGSWTLGQFSGTNTLIAMGPGQMQVTITAEAVGPCPQPAGYTSGTVQTGSLATSDCPLDNGAYSDFYKTSVFGAIRFTLTSSAFNSRLYVRSLDHTPVADNDNATSVTHDASVKLLVPLSPGPGGWGLVVIASSAASGETGDYAVASAQIAEGVTNCEEVFIIRGAQSVQNLETTDCTGSSFYDRFKIYLEAGESVTIGMDASTFGKKLELFDPSGNNVSAATGTDSIAYTPLVTGYYVIHAGSALPNQTGSYTIRINH